MGIPLGVSLDISILMRDYWTSVEESQHTVGRSLPYTPISIQNGLRIASLQWCPHLFNPSLSHSSLLSLLHQRECALRMCHTPPTANISMLSNENSSPNSRFHLPTALSLSVISINAPSPLRTIMISSCKCNRKRSLFSSNVYLARKKEEHKQSRGCPRSMLVVTDRDPLSFICEVAEERALGRCKRLLFILWCC